MTAVECNIPLTAVRYHRYVGKETGGVAVDFETRRKKQQALMVRLVERKVRSRARQLYETRGQQEGQHLEDWLQAESEVLENSAVAPLYKRLRNSASESEENSSEIENRVTDDSQACETTA